MPRLIHLNGPPGIGKSTLARRYAAAHPGVLCCDIDLLRTLVGGWEADFAGAGAVIRPVALAMIGAHLAGGRDVVLPQLLLDPRELARFEGAARDAGADFVERVLLDTGPTSVERFHRRGADTPDPWHDRVREIVADLGGDAYLADCHARLEQLLRERPGAVAVASLEGAADETYRALEATLG